MRLKVANRIGGSLAAALFVALGVLACKGTGSYESGVKGFGLEGYVKGTYTCGAQGPGARVDEVRDDARVDLEFRDGQGNKVGGATGVSAGQSVPVPVGTTTVTVSGPSSATSCTGCSGSGLVDNAGGDGGSQAFEITEEITLDPSDYRNLQSHHAPSVGHQAVRPFMPKDYWLYVFPFDAQIDSEVPEFGPLSNTYAQFDIHSAAGKTSDQLWAMVAPVMLSEIGNQPAVPSNIEVKSFFKIVPNQSGFGARLYVADRTAAFEAFHFELNGALMATLGANSTLTSEPNGWKVLEVPIGVSDFIFNGNISSNAMTVWTDTAESGVEGFEGNVAYW